MPSFYFRTIFVCVLNGMKTNCKCLKIILKEIFGDEITRRILSYITTVIKSKTLR